jgi:sugar/nucleoside kinase (ribokinase family)
MPDVLSAGIIVADHLCTPIDHLPAAGELVMAERLIVAIGGCAANAGVDLAKMGVDVAVVGRVGDDVFGGVVTGMLRDAGIDTGLIQTTPGVDTSATLIVNVKGQDRRFIHTFGANAKFSARDLPVDRLAGTKVLYVGGYLAMPGLEQNELAALFWRARELGVKTVLDVVVPGPGEYLDHFTRLLPFTDVFLPNHWEAEILTNESDPVRQAAVFRELGAGVAVITMGGDGSVLMSKDMTLRAGTFPIDFVDGSGGGDAFDAGFICGLLRDAPLDECLRLGSALGASCVRTVGTTPGVFTRTECDAFLQANKLSIERLR